MREANPSKDRLLPGLTVVIPVHNRAGLIGRALDSVLRQTRRPERVVVVDNGSTDSTVAAIREWVKKNGVASNLKETSPTNASFRLDLYSEKRPGAAAARNRGLEEVRTEWVYFFDSDDEMLPSLCEDAMQASDGCDLVYWKLATVMERGQWIKPFSRKRLVRRHIFNGLLSTQAFMVRTDFIRSVGGWNAEAMAWNDWELGFRLLLAVPKIGVVEKVEALIYPQKESITGTASSRKTGVWENTLSTMDQTIDSLQEEPMKGLSQGYDRKRLHGMISYRRAILAAHYEREGAKAEARALLEKTLKEFEGSSARKLLLRLIYRYTALGGRAAYLLWR